ncbi:hypothetical protein ACWV26_16585 [Rummeliibacillus sp. JY-2-4R]
MRRRRGELSTEEKIFTRIKMTDEEVFEKFERDCLLKNLRPSLLSFTEMKLQHFKNQ